MIYENCRILGPYKRKNDGRKHIVIIYPDGRKSTISYPKYLMELKLDRYLTKDETVDHLDMNIDNNDYSNLEIKFRSQHVLDDIKRLKPQEFICPICETKFIVESKRLHHIITNRRQGCAGPFCSKSRAGKYGALVQTNQMDELQVNQIIPEYYNLKGFEFEYKKPNQSNPDREWFNPNRKFTDDEVIEIRLKFINKDLDIKGIKTKYNLSTKTTRNILSGKSYEYLPHTCELPESTYFKSSKNLIEEWKQLRVEGKSYREIAKLYNVDHSTIQYQLKKNE